MIKELEEVVVFSRLVEVISGIVATEIGGVLGSAQKQLVSTKQRLVLGVKEVETIAVEQRLTDSSQVDRLQD